MQGSFYAFQLSTNRTLTQSHWITVFVMSLSKLFEQDLPEILTRVLTMHDICEYTHTWLCTHFCLFLNHVDMMDPSSMGKYAHLGPFKGKGAGRQILRAAGACQPLEVKPHPSPCACPRQVACVHHHLAPHTSSQLHSSCACQLVCACRFLVASHASFLLLSHTHTHTHTPARKHTLTHAQAVKGIP